MTTPPEDFLGELRLSRRLTSVTQVVAASWVILIGLLFLLARETLTFTGPRSSLASLLAFLVLGLTLLSAAELLGGSGERGGNYMLVHETLGGWSAFITGWSLLAGSLALAAAFLRETAAQLLGSFLSWAILSHFTQPGPACRDPPHRAIPNPGPVPTAPQPDHPPDRRVCHSAGRQRTAVRSGPFPHTDPRQSGRVYGRTGLVMCRVPGV